MWYPLSIGTPLAFAVLAIVGYYYTAEQLTERLTTTVWLALGLFLVQALVSRWARIADNRLQSELAAQAAAAVADQAATPETLGESEAPGESIAENEFSPSLQEPRGNPLWSPEVPAVAQTDPPVVVAELRPDEPQTSNNAHQMRALVQGVMLLCFVLGSWSIWSNVLPALGILDRVELWSTTVSVAETIDNGVGKSVTQMVDKRVPITLAHMLLCMAIIAITIASAKNVPGLMESLCGFAARSANRRDQYPWSAYSDCRMINGTIAKIPTSGLPHRSLTMQRCLDLKRSTCVVDANLAQKWMHW